jgi:iron complex outermembrane recepter protein
VGTNTVNGVINIITKSSMDTKGGRIIIGGGSTHPGDYLARYGGKLGSNAAYRAFGHYSDFNPLTFGTSKANDGWSIGSGGFRLDWNRSKNDSIMVQGNAFQMNGDQTTLIVAPYGGLGQLAGGVSDNGSDIFTQWKHRFSDHSETTLQFYDSNYQRIDAGNHEKLGTADFDFQHHDQIARLSVPRSGHPTSRHSAG